MLIIGSSTPARGSYQSPYWLTILHKTCCGDNLNMTVLEDLQARREASEDALNKKVEDLNRAVTPTVTDATASSSRIGRCIAGVEAKWEDYEQAHYTLKAKLTVNTQNPADCPVAKLTTLFDKLYRVQ